MIEIKGSKYQLENLKEIIENGLMHTQDPLGCDPCCRLDEDDPHYNDCKYCFHRYVDNILEWYDSDTECIRHNENGKWQQYPAEKIKWDKGDNIWKI